MRTAVVLALVLGCGGPSHDQLIETPAATRRRRPVEAPPASTSDRDRERLIQQFDDMQTTQDAYREAGGAKKPPPNPDPGQAPPKKKGIAEQAPPEPPKPSPPAPH